QNDVVEFTRLAQAADRADADLILLARARGLRADLAGGDLHVLFAQRIHHFARRDAAAREPIGIQPQPHCVLALAEDLDVADAGNAPQVVAYQPIEENPDAEQ